MDVSGSETSMSGWECCEVRSDACVTEAQDFSVVGVGVGPLDVNIVGRRKQTGL